VTFSLTLDAFGHAGRRVCQSAEALYDLGANSVGAIATHGIFSGNAIQKVQASDLEYLVVSDSCPIEDKYRRSANKIIQVGIRAGKMPFPMSTSPKPLLFHHSTQSKCHETGLGIF